MGVKGRKWIKTTAKRAYWESKKYWKAYFQAKDEHLNRESPVSFIKRTFYKILERVDPLEAVAVIGGTILVHDVIFKMEEFMQEIKKVQAASPFPADWLLRTFLTAMGQGGSQEWETDPALQGKINIMNSDAAMWISSFCIAYFTIKHGDDLLGVAKKFFGIKT